MTKNDLLEVIDSWENLELAIQEIGNNAEHLPVLMNLALYNSKPRSWRAAWMADKIHNQYLHLIIPWLDQMIPALKNKWISAYIPKK